MSVDKLKLMQQNVFENAAGATRRWIENDDGSLIYYNPSDSKINEYAGITYGGHLGGSGDVSSTFKVPAGDYTLVIPVETASTLSKGVHINYRLSTDGKQWDKNVYYTHLFNTVESNSKLMLKVNVPADAYFGFSLSFDSVPGTGLNTGKPQLVTGMLDGAVGGGELTPDLTEYGFNASSTLPHGWNTGYATPEKVSATITPAGYEWSYKLDNKGWIITPYAACNKGGRLRITLTVSRWSESENLIFGSWINYEWGVSEPYGMTINAADLPVGRWVEKSYEVTAQRTGMADILIWTGGEDTAHIASMRVERLAVGQGI